MDLHAGQIQGFFNIPVDNLYAAPVLLNYIKENFQNNLVIVSPDVGGVERARAFAKRLNAQIAIIDKRRDRPNSSEVMHIVGNVKGCTVVLLDDMVDTAGTLTKAAAALADQGAAKDLCLRHPPSAFRPGPGYDHEIPHGSISRHRHHTLTGQGPRLPQDQGPLRSPPVRGGHSKDPRRRLGQFTVCLRKGKNHIMEQVTLEGFLRESSGKGPARTLRRAGKIPADFLRSGVPRRFLFSYPRPLWKKF